MRRRLPALAQIAALLGISFIGGCSGGHSDDCPVGAERCPCTAGGACDSGLVCASGLCVRFGSDAGADADGDAGIPAGDDSPMVCAEAPGCAGAATPGTITTALESLTPSAPPAGCLPTKLRVRLTSVTVNDAEDTVPESDEIYCVTSARAPNGGEIRLLPVISSLGDGDTGTWPVETGVVWGQWAEPVATGGALQVGIDCLEQDDPAGFSDYTVRLATAAVGAGGTAADNGWVFLAGIDVAAVVAAASWPSADDHVFAATLTIAEGVQLAATPGAWTAIRRFGGSYPNEFDWETRLEVWGCTENGILPH